MVCSLRIITAFLGITCFVHGLRATIIPCSLRNVLTCSTRNKIKPFYPQRILHCRAAADGSGLTNPESVPEAARGNIRESDFFFLAVSNRVSALEIDNAFIAITLPALVQFAAEPLAFLVNAMYLGRLGVAVSGGAGIAVCTYYAISKVFNDPLLRTSISIVAADNSKFEEAQAKQYHKVALNSIPEDIRDNLDKSVSSAVLLAFAVGLLQAVFFMLTSVLIVRAMGISAGSEMYPHALSYLRARAIGAPFAAMGLAINGIVRGLGDNYSSMKYAFVLSTLSIFLNPFLIFDQVLIPSFIPWLGGLTMPGIGLGAVGAGVGITIAQFVAFGDIWNALRQKSMLGNIDLSTLWPNFKTYVFASTLVNIRTFAKVGVYAVCAREAALLGSAASACHHLMFMLGRPVSQMSEAVSLATQSLLVKEIAHPAVTPAAKAKKNFAAWHVIRRGCTSGLGVALALGAVACLAPVSIVSKLTTDPSVQALCLATLPIMLLFQVAMGAAYPINGVLMGGMDWKWSSRGIWAANVACLLALAIGRILPGGQSLTSIWASLAVFMWVQSFTGVYRITSNSGPWSKLNENVVPDKLEKSSPSPGRDLKGWEGLKRYT